MRVISKGQASLYTFLLAVLLTLAAMQSAWSSGPPSTHMLLPSPRTTAEMQRLAGQTDAIAVVITTQCEERVFTVSASQPEALSGHILTPPAASQAETPPQPVVEPFDSIALVFYTEPASPRVALLDRLPIKSAFPSPPAVGEAERYLSCARLDTELSRSEALRWVARDHGATPYTGAERLNLHVKHAAIDAAVAVGVVALLAVSAGPGFAAGGGALGSGGGGGGSHAYHYAANVWYVEPEEFRWAISAIDARVEGLLRLKKQNQCAGRPALQAGTTDLALLEGFDAWKAEQSPVRDEHAVLAKRTNAFDELGPKSVVLPDREATRAYLQAARLEAAQRLLPPDEHVEQILSDALWFGETRFPKSDVPHGDIVVTDKSLLFAHLANFANSPEKQQTSVHIPYAQLETVGVAHWGVSKWVMIRTKDGHTRYFLFDKPNSIMIDREATQAAADILRTKVGAGAGGASSENQPETR